MGQPFFGTEDEFNFLKDNYNTFLTHRLTQTTGKFFETLLPEYHSLFKFVPYWIDGKKVNARQALLIYIYSETCVGR